MKNNTKKDYKEWFKVDANTVSNITNEYKAEGFINDGPRDRFKEFCYKVKSFFSRITTEKTTPEAEAKFNKKIYRSISGRVTAAVIIGILLLSQAHLVLDVTKIANIESPTGILTYPIYVIEVVILAVSNMIQNYHIFLPWNLETWWLSGVAGGGPVAAKWLLWGYVVYIIVFKKFRSNEHINVQYMITRKVEDYISTFIKEESMKDISWTITNEVANIVNDKRFTNDTLLKYFNNAWKDYHYMYHKRLEIIKGADTYVKKDITITD